MKRFLCLLLFYGCGTGPAPCDGIMDDAALVHAAGAVKVLQMNGVGRYEAMAYCNAVDANSGTPASECCRWIVFQFYGNDGSRDWETPVGYVGPFYGELP